MKGYDLIVDISNGKYIHNDIDDYVNGDINRAQDLYESIWVEWYVQPSGYFDDAMSYLRTKYGCSWGKEPKHGTAKNSKLIVGIRSLITKENKDDVLTKIHKTFDDYNRPSDKVRFILCCSEPIDEGGVGLLSRHPTWKEFQAEFGNQVGKSTFESYINRNKDDRWKDYKIEIS